MGSPPRADGDSSTLRCLTCGAHVPPPALVNLLHDSFIIEGARGHVSGPRAPSLAMATPIGLDGQDARAALAVRAGARAAGARAEADADDAYAREGVSAGLGDWPLLGLTLDKVVFAAGGGAHPSSPPRHSVYAANVGGVSLAASASAPRVSMERIPPPLGRAGATLRDTQRVPSPLAAAAAELAEHKPPPIFGRPSSSVGPARVRSALDVRGALYRGLAPQSVDLLEHFDEHRRPALPHALPPSPWMGKRPSTTPHVSRDAGACKAAAGGGGASTPARAAVDASVGRSAEVRAHDSLAARVTYRRTSAARARAPTHPSRTPPRAPLGQMRTLPQLRDADADDLEQSPLVAIVYDSLGRSQSLNRTEWQRRAGGGAAREGAGGSSLAAGSTSRPVPTSVRGGEGEGEMQ